MPWAPDDDDLSADDAHILTLESSSVTGHTLKLNVLGPGPQPVDLEALRDAVDARLPRQPRARMRVDTSGSVARWVPVDSFDIRAHVRRRPSPTAVRRQTCGGSSAG